VTAAHGGSVMVRSVEGAGSTFTLRLPLRSDHDGSSPDRARA
jgi:signal transduction histidine kinase